MSAKITKKTVKKKQDVKSVLLQRALGYDAVETVEEYASNNGEIVLTKKKITTKNVPPDITALKLLIETDERPIERYTDEELEQEKQRLLKLLSEQKNKEKIIANQKTTKGDDLN